MQPPPPGRPASRLPCEGGIGSGGTPVDCKRAMHPLRCMHGRPFASTLAQGPPPNSCHMLQQYMRQQNINVSSCRWVCEPSWREQHASCPAPRPGG